MRQILTGTWNGTGAAVYLCVGAIPVDVVLADIEADTNPNLAIWRREFLKCATTYGGLYITGSSGAYTKLTSAGVFPYEGGDLMTSANQTSTAYGDGVYLGWDDTNYQADYTYGALTAGTPINKWTLDNGSTGAGHFNSSGVASGCRIGVGSIIRIKEDSTGLVKEASIAALSSTPTFTTASYVTLSRIIGTGTITYIGGMHSLKPISIGKVAPAGIFFNDTTLGVNDHSCSFRMEVEIGGSQGV